jgi:hypothetical protein
MCDLLLLCFTPCFVSFWAFSFPMLEQCCSMLGWNVRGLNDQDRKDTVHETIANSSCHIACLQETKLHSISAFDASYIGGYRLKSFAYKPADGT